MPSNPDRVAFLIETWVEHREIDRLAPFLRASIRELGTAERNYVNGPEDIGAYIAEAVGRRVGTNTEWEDKR